MSRWHPLELFTFFAIVVYIVAGVRMSVSAQTSPPILPSEGGSSPPAANAGTLAEPLIQGSVLAVQESVITVKTPNYGPGLEHSSRPHSMLIVAGKTFHVDVSHALFETPDGRSQSRGQTPAVGDSVMVLLSMPTAVGKADDSANPPTYTATIVERDYAK